mgnify:CR=1 FL=1
MDIDGEYLVPAGRERVWEALNDPQVLRRCIPGCEEIERVSDAEMRARILAAVGPVRAKFATTLTLEDLEPPSRYTLAGEAKAGAAGFGRGRAQVTLAEADGGTRLSYRADFKVGGRLAQVGARLVTGATRKTADEFFSNLAQELGAEPAPAAAPEGRGRLLAWLAALVLAALLLYFMLR